MATGSMPVDGLAELSLAAQENKATRLAKSELRTVR
jgi:hypothetical protein